MMPTNSQPDSTVAPLARAPGTSLHRHLFVVLRDEVLRGVYFSGLLPKEEALCERFGVSRITVRRALSDLAATGLVERRHGRGTFVREEHLPLARARPTLTLIDGLRKAANDTQVQVLKVERTEAPMEVGAMLQLATDEKAVHALRLRTIEGIPVMLTDAWVPASLGKHVTVTTLRKHALYEILLAQGVKFGRVIQEITAEVSSPELARLMQTEIGVPMLKFVRIIHDTEARPVQYITVTMTPERSRILMDIPGVSVNTLSAGHFVHEVSAKR